MRATVFVGLILIALGVLGLAYQGFTYVSREKIVDAGPIQVTADRERTVWVPPLLGGAAVLAGATLCAIGMRKST